MDEHILNTQFVRQYEEYQSDIFRFCYIKTSDRELAKDLTQQAFLKAYKYIKEGNKIDNFKVFIYQTARNLIIDHYRRAKSTSLDQMMGGDDEGKDGEGSTRFEPSYNDDIESRAEYGLAMEKLDQLDPEDRDLILLRYVSDLSIKEIADMYCERPNTVSVKVHRAIKELKKKFS